MAFTNIHPAPGLGELMPGFYVVPQNPITMAQTGMGYSPRMGDLLPAAFTVPQNPIVNNFQTGMQGMGTMGCAPGSKCGMGFMGSLAGMGEGESEIALDPTAVLPSTWDKSTMWIVIAGAFVLLLSYKPNTGQKRSELKRLKGAYERKAGEIKGQYRTVGGSLVQGAKDLKAGKSSRKAAESTSLMPFD